MSNQGIGINVSSIINGDFDNQLDKIGQAVNMRRKTLKQQARQLNLVQFGQGDRVKTKNLSPKYANGLIGTIVDKKRTRFVVEFDDGQHTGRFSSRVTVPAECLETL